MYKIGGWYWDIGFINPTFIDIVLLFSGPIKFKIVYKYTKANNIGIKLYVRVWLVLCTISATVSINNINQKLILKHRYVIGYIIFFPLKLFSQNTLVILFITKLIGINVYNDSIEQYNIIKIHIL